MNMNAMLRPARARYTDRRALRRARQRERGSPSQPVSNRPWPTRPPPSKWGGALWLLLSVVVHGSVLLIARWLPAKAEPPHSVQEITVLIHEAPPPPPPVLPEPPPLPVKLPPPRPEQRLAPQPEPLPPPDPIDLQPPPPDAPLPPPARRVVGLSLESTVVGGAGPAVAVGNTRMGETAPIAADPSVEPLRQELTPARRLTDEKPEYPQELRARSVEGDVGLQVELDAHGLITQVTVVASSGFPAFDASAVASALRATYEAAKLNGVAVAQVLRFTVRFRLRQ